MNWPKRLLYITLTCGEIVNASTEDVKGAIRFSFSAIDPSFFEFLINNVDNEKITIAITTSALVAPMITVEIVIVAIASAIYFLSCSKVRSFIVENTYNKSAKVATPTGYGVAVNIEKLGIAKAI